MGDLGLYTKAIVAFITPGLIAVGAALADGSDGGRGITGVEWVGIALASLATSTLVFSVKNQRSTPSLGTEQTSQEEPEPTPIAEEPPRA